MKHVIKLASASIAVVTVLFLSCQKEEGGIPSDGTLPYTTHETIVEPPTNLIISADNSGKMVVLRWDASPTEEIDGYAICFKPIGSEFRRVATVDPSVTQTTINPLGKAGYYHITAFKGEFESEPTEDVSTVPVHSSTTTIYELGADGNSGYGWNRETGEGTTYAMNVSANARYVDFYITNFTRRYTATPYYIASPDVSQYCADSSIVPPAHWKSNGIKLISSIEADSVIPAAGNYLNYEYLGSNSYYGIHTEDNYFAVVHAIGVYNPQNGTQDIETWFQLVRGLRILNHSPDDEHK